MNPHTVPFNRPPRVRQALPAARISLPTPPAPPGEEPALNKTVLGLSVVGGLASGAMMLVISGSALFILPVIAFAVITLVTTLVQHDQQVKQIRRTLEVQESRFLDALGARAKEIAQAAALQRQLMLDTDPGSEELVARVGRVDRRLWERSPRDEDFLSLRVGLGDVQPSFLLEVPVLDYTQVGPLASRLQKLAKENEKVRCVPVCAAIHQVGHIAIVGGVDPALSLVRSMLCGLAVHHAPSEVQLLAACGRGRAREWEWIRWLPHAGAFRQTPEWRTLSMDPVTAGRVISTVEDELRRRQQQASLRAASSAEERQAWVLVIDDLGSVERHPGFGLLMAHGAALGIYVLVIVDRPTAVPRGCGAVIELRAAGGAQLAVAGVPGEAPVFAPDAMSTATAEHLARGLAPLEEPKAQLGTELPESIGLLDLLRGEGGGELLVEEWWRGALLPCARGRLQVPLGLMGGGRPLVFDPEKHGWHGLVAGTTGAGKSELLRSLVSALALTHHPHEVGFILVDFKGGSAFGELERLPHTIGMVTNLTKSLVERCLNAIETEQVKRQGLFRDAGVSKILQYQASGHQPPLPVLFIVVDEYAELHDQYEDLMTRLVSVTRLGRSLGIWLLLATQRPAGKVKDEMSANMGYRMCLRVQSAEDSRDVLRGRPDAAALPVIPPGRMYYMGGDNPVPDLVQVAHVVGNMGAARLDEAPSGAMFEILPDGTRRPLVVREPATTTTAAFAEPEQKTVVAQICELTQRVARARDIEQLPGLWLRPLEQGLKLSELFAQLDLTPWTEAEESQDPPLWLKAPVGRYDEPERQRQPVLLLDLTQDGGHHLVAGAAQSGLDLFLRTLVYGLAMLHTPADLWFYLIDFGGMDLRPLAGLPHVGAVLGPAEPEQLRKLFEMLENEVSSRAELWDKSNVTTHESLRKRLGRESPPAIVVVVNNIFQFRESHEWEVAQLIRLARVGGPLGIHLVVAGSRPSDVPSQLMGSLSNRLCFRLSDAADYEYILPRKPVGTGESVPSGRGWRAKPFHEFQTALTVDGPESEQVERLRARVAAVDDAWKGLRPEPVRTLPTTVALAEVLALPHPANQAPAPPETTRERREGRALRVPMGLDATRLRVVTHELTADRPHAFIAGPPLSGKTTALTTWVVGLAALHSPQVLRMVLIGTRRASLRDLGKLPHVRLAVETLEGLATAADLLQAETERRQRAEEPTPSLVVVIDDVDHLLKRARNTADPGVSRFMDLLDRVANEGGDVGIHVIVSGATGEMDGCYESVVRTPRTDRSGFLLQTYERFDLPMFGLRLREGTPKPELPPGRAYTAARGQLELVQLASPEIAGIAPSSPSTVAGWVEAIVGLWPEATNTTAGSPTDPGVTAGE